MGLNQQEFAGKMGLSRTTLSAYETGKRPTASFVRALKRAYPQIDLSAYIDDNIEEPTVVQERVTIEDRLERIEEKLDRLLERLSQ